MAANALRIVDDGPELELIVRRDGEAEVAQDRQSRARDRPGFARCEAGTAQEILAQGIGGAVGQVIVLLAVLERRHRDGTTIDGLRGRTVKKAVPSGCSATSRSQVVSVLAGSARCRVAGSETPRA